jgi:endonuclease/exonuclease/phosphatase family metal-dependent hydrolase
VSASELDAARAAHPAEGRARAGGAELGVPGSGTLLHGDLAGVPDRSSRSWADGWSPGARGYGPAVRLATFNLLNGTSLSDRQVVVARLHEAVTQLGADVVGLQEVDRGQARSHGLDLTAEVARAAGVLDAGPAHWRFVPALVGTPGGDWRAATDEDDDGAQAHYGIGLVSRWPVRSWHVVRLPAAPVRSPVALPGTRRVVWLQDEPRVGLAAVVDGPAGVMTVATTHLSFVPVWNGVQLRTFTRTLQSLPGPRVLLGDLNMPGAVPRWLTGWQVLARVATYPAWEPKIQLDHVLGSGTLPAVTAVETPELALSDHRALLVELGGGAS